MFTPVSPRCPQQKSGRSPDQQSAAVTTLCAISEIFFFSFIASDAAARRLLFGKTAHFHEDAFGRARRACLFECGFGFRQFALKPAEGLKRLTAMSRIGLTRSFFNPSTI